MRRRFRWPVLVAALAFTAALSVAAVELALRLVGVEYPVFWQVDEELGIALRPDIRGWYRDEGHGWVETNAYGMRDVARTREKPGNSFRIAVLGDSYAEAIQVDRENGFAARLEAELAECRAFGGRRVEVLNFGCSGYGTAQELLAFRTRAKAFAPDLVLVAFLAGNDLADNSRAMDPEIRRPYFVRKDGRLALDQSFRESAYFRSRRSPWLTWIVDHFRIAQVAYAFKRSKHRGLLAGRGSRRAPTATPAPTPALPSASPLTPSAAPVSAPPSAAPSPTTSAPGDLTELRARQAGLYEAVFYPPATDQWREAWAVTEGLMLLLRDEVRASGAELAVVLVTNGIDVHPDRRMREAFRAALGVPDLEYPARRLSTFLAGAGVPALPLGEPFRANAERTGVALHGFAAQGSLGGGHWNEAGHRLAGRLLADWLQRDPVLTERWRRDRLRAP